MLPSSARAGKSAFALASEEESLQDETLGTGLAVLVEEGDGEGDGDAPTDGMQYLKQVVKEAQKLDAVSKGEEEELSLSLLHSQSESMQSKNWRRRKENAYFLWSF